MRSYIECPNCNGAGRVEVLNATQSRTAVEPATHTEHCHVCDGLGEITATVCPVCHQPEDACPCTEDDFVALGRCDFNQVFA